MQRQQTTGDTQFSGNFSILHLQFCYFPHWLRQHCCCCALFSPPHVFKFRFQLFFVAFCVIAGSFCSLHCKALLLLLWLFFTGTALFQLQLSRCNFCRLISKALKAAGYCDLIGILVVGRTSDSQKEIKLVSIGIQCLLSLDTKSKRSLRKACRNCRTNSNLAEYKRTQLAALVRIV